jgi:hypothetical protein
MMRKVVLVMVIALMGINSYGQMGGIKCKNAVDSFKANWQYLDSLHYYKTKLTNQDIEYYSECFKGMDSVNVKKIFGEPSRRYKGYQEICWEYNLDKSDGEKFYTGLRWVINVYTGVIFSKIISTAGPFYGDIYR